MFLSRLTIALVLGSIVCAAEQKQYQTANFEEAHIVDSGDWYIIAATAASGSSVNKCGHFVVKKLSENTFTMKYIAVSHKRNSLVVYNVNGTVGNDVTEIWQLQGSAKFIGPVKQFILEGTYDSSLAISLCGEESADLPGHKIAMIWSRKTRLSSYVTGKTQEKA